MNQWYGEVVQKNVTISLPEDILRWARKKAIDEDTSLSSLVSGMLGEERSRSAEYWKAFEDWKEMGPIPGLDASKRLTREEAHARHR